MIKDFQEAEQALQKLIKIEAEQKKLHSVCRKKTRPWYEKISKILLQVQQKDEQLAREIKKLHMQLEQFAQNSRNMWPGKSLKLTHGTIGFREKVKIEVSKDTAQILLDLGYSDYVQVRRSADRKKMRELDENILYQAGAQKIIEDQFYISTIRNGGWNVL